MYIVQVIIVVDGRSPPKSDPAKNIVGIFFLSRMFKTKTQRVPKLKSGRARMASL